MGIWSGRPEKPVKVSIDGDIIAEFRELAEQTNDSISWMINRALREWLDKNRKAHDDKIHKSEW